MLLTPKEIWNCSDPFTIQTCRHPRAYSVYYAKHHRLLGDLNRAPTPETAFREKDFRNNTVWKPGKDLTTLEKAELLGKNWFPHYEQIIQDIHTLFEKGHKKVFFIDHHNAAVDHPLDDKHMYLPSMVISNLGSRNRGARVRSYAQATSLPSNAMKVFQKNLKEQTGLGVEINHIYRGGYAVRWVVEHGLKNHAGCKIYAVQLEYNLNMIHNPLSGRNDMVALKILRNGINKAVNQLAEYLKL